MGVLRAPRVHSCLIAACHRISRRTPTDDVAIGLRAQALSILLLPLLLPVLLPW